MRSLTVIIVISLFLVSMFQFWHPNSSTLDVSVNADSGSNPVIQNGGFEQGLTGWTVGGGGFVNVTGAKAHSGSYSMETSSSIGQQAYFCQNISCLNTSFVFSFWLFRNDSKSWTACYLDRDWDGNTARVVSSLCIQDDTIELNAWDDPYAPGRQVFNYTVTVGAWHNVTFAANATLGIQDFYLDGDLIETLNSSSGDVFSPEILIFGDVSTEACNGTFYFDDFELARAGWLDGWSYRKSLTITGASGAGTDYQIRLPVCYNEVEFDHLYDIVNPLGLDAYSYGAQGVLHPTVLYFPDKMDGYEYWMLYTPYNTTDPGTNAEQACIIRSHNRVNWTDYGISNPVIGRGNFNCNPDPNFIYVSAYSTWFMVITKESFYGDARGENRTISLYSSTNGKNWTDKGTLIDGSRLYETNCTYGWPFVTEPAIVYDNNWFYVWYCVINNNTRDDSNMRRSVCLAKFQWDSNTNNVTNFQRVEVDGKPIFTPDEDDVYYSGTGHIAVAKYNGVYYLFGARSRKDAQNSGFYDICLWSCTDRIHWNTSSYGAVVPHGVSGSWDAYYVYRGGPVTDGEGNIVTIENRPYIYFSGVKDSSNINKIGFAYMDKGFTYMECVSCKGHCKEDFGDIRFTDDDGTTLLDYWNESQTNGDNAVFWVEVADNLNSAQTIYIYYGNSAATSATNGDNTFQFFDNFAGTSLNTTKWVVDSGVNISVSNNIVTATLASAGYKGIVQNKTTYSTFGGNVRMRWNGSQQYASYRYGIQGLTIDGNPNNGHQCAGFVWSSTNGKYWWTVGPTNYTYTLFASDSNFHKFEVLRLGSGDSPAWNCTFVYDGTTLGSKTTYVPTAGLNVSSTMYPVSGSMWQKMSWVFVGKYVSPEPIPGFWGSEEMA
jgi:hypothetical protein